MNEARLADSRPARRKNSERGTESSRKTSGTRLLCSDEQMVRSCVEPKGFSRAETERREDGMQSNDPCWNTALAALCTPNLEESKSRSQKAVRSRCFEVGGQGIGMSTFRPSGGDMRCTWGFRSRKARGQDSIDGRDTQD